MAEQKASAGASVDVSGATAAEEFESNRRLAILLAMAMFVLVVDTSVLNVSISARGWTLPSVPERKEGHGEDQTGQAVSRGCRRPRRSHP